MEELDGALPESGSKTKEEGNLEMDGNQDEGLVEVWQLLISNLLALLYIIVATNITLSFFLIHLHILCMSELCAVDSRLSSLNGTEGCLDN
jgi:hypothetical protein